MTEAKEKKTLKQRIIDARYSFGFTVFVLYSVDLFIRYQSNFKALPVLEQFCIVGFMSFLMMILFFKAFPKTPTRDVIEECDFKHTAKSALGNILYPDHTQKSLTLNQLIGELLKSRSENIRLSGASPNRNESDNPITIDGFGQAIYNMPKLLKANTTSPAWAKECLDQWVTVLKPSLIADLEYALISKQQSTPRTMVMEFLFRLETIGVRIEGKNNLLSEIDCRAWHESLLEITMTGRKRGIQLIAPSQLTPIPEELYALLTLYGFDRKMSESFISASIQMEPTTSFEGFENKNGKMHVE